MEVTARAKYVRVSPQKARLVTELVKGKKVEEGEEGAAAPSGKAEQKSEK